VYLWFLISFSPEIYHSSTHTLQIQGKKKRKKEKKEEEGKKKD